MGLAPARAAYTLADLWHRFGWAPAKNVFDGGPGLQESMGVRYAINKLDGEC